MLIVRCDNLVQSRLDRFHTLDLFKIVCILLLLLKELGTVRGRLAGDEKTPADSG